MTTAHESQVWELLLLRKGLVFPQSEGDAGGLAQALAINLAEIGYLPSHELQMRLAECSVNELALLRKDWLQALLRSVGGNRTHTPLFRRFPKDVPHDTEALWLQRALVHFFQGQDQVCLFCESKASTHLLSPCRHVVCDRCFDGSNYSGCPICGVKVDPDSPFFVPSTPRLAPNERVQFKLLRLGLDLDTEARTLFESLCARPQALNPDDLIALRCILRTYGTKVLTWLPAKIPLKENIAIIFATLFASDGANEILEAAKQYIGTATDVLRFIAVLSGTDGSLQPEIALRVLPKPKAQAESFRDKVFSVLGLNQDLPDQKAVAHPVPCTIRRFKVAKMSRATRRSLLGILEGFGEDQLTEDMLRHRSYWVWVGQFLHPHEYAKRFPVVAAAFKVLRKTAPDGTENEKYQTWNARVEAKLSARAHSELIRQLMERPGDFGRRLDHVLRSAPDAEGQQAVLRSFGELIPRLATPMLVSLLAHFGQRHKRQPMRIYWPKGQCAYGASTKDTRKLLPKALLSPLLNSFEGELLNRFAKLKRYETVVLDQALDRIIVPFNERTAAPAAVSLPRGSRVRVPPGKLIRLFLHWCEPKQAEETDLDLSVGFYTKSWDYIGPCSYYELELKGRDGEVIARSAGDTTSAPPPDGASEFIDVLCEPALRAKAKYAVMVINAYSGLPFDGLDRAFAGVMVRDDPMGTHFDPRTVELKFNLQGANGVYLPVCFDLETMDLHWLDVSAKGYFAMNNVETSDKDIKKVVPELMTYFGSGVRASMFTLGQLHAAARAKTVIVRGEDVRSYERGPDEPPEKFAGRIARGLGGTLVQALELGTEPVLGLLYRGDLELPEGSEIYALFRDQLSPTLTASDLLSG